MGEGVEMERLKLEREGRREGRERYGPVVTVTVGREDSQRGKG